MGFWDNGINSLKSFSYIVTNFVQYEYYSHRSLLICSCVASWRITRLTTPQRDRRMKRRSNMMIDQTRQYDYKPTTVNAHKGLVATERSLHISQFIITSTSSSSSSLSSSPSSFFSSSSSLYQFTSSNPYHRHYRHSHQAQGPPGNTGPLRTPLHI